MAERTQQLTETNELLRERVEEIGRVEESLREEKAFTDAVMDSLPGVFYVLDDETRFVRWNRHMEEVTGLTADQLRAAARRFPCSTRRSGARTALWRAPSRPGPTRPESCAC